jgi:hypothetical protein
VTKDPFALADRETGPMPNWHDFPTSQDYRAAWYLARAQRRDAEPTAAERAAAFGALCWRLGYPEDYRP